jgi:hypothetical protein
MTKVASLLCHKQVVYVIAPSSKPKSSRSVVGAGQPLLPVPT